ncbi:multiple sugar transport system permease protein/raffinose/stachyose/melibiose transport system permease protein [Kitasatospora gansuensis]|uniref:Multiple sugar transport system permease protein/raffinose/stachyose/melibiose transport system permease protein n=1 Tax=Kitasatospora gansuensis TaxID=258050 RepID=A0A7W7WFT1_9ACTN|nr:sugar ABC transporter permease [Kitasatospora gansuensis]MBB4945511.1 multiple sugar transport system permease protein/raffinose/stachyose/melibiose transport system permease protein [Kitasatospora gansuensis]
MTATFRLDSPADPATPEPARTPTAPAADGKRRRAKNAARRGEARAGLAMASPAIVLLLTFLIVPVLLGFALSFTNARLISPEPLRFVGFDNFVRAFTIDPTFFRSALNTFAFAAVVVPVQAGFGLFLALMVNQKIRGVTAFRVIFFIPVVTSIVVVSILWKFMYQPDGLVNSFINSITFGAWQGTAWLDNPSTALFAIIVLSVWQAVGFHMLIWLSGLQTIPEELYEAARIDGAGTWRQFRDVTWPCLRPTRIFVLITITIAALGLFVQIDVMTQGGPIDSTSTLVYHAVLTGYRQQQIGYGSALSLVFFVIVLVIALIQRHLTRDKD